MQFKNGLAVFQKTNSRRSWNIASWHSRHSLTWSWVLSLALDGAFWHHERHRPRMGFYPHANNQGFQWVLCLPGAVLQWHRQQPMWFRDLWQRARSENEELKHLTRTAMPRPPLRSPFVPTVIDGGSSVH